ncbi:MAG: type II toxin-antitoxin system HicA family toxin [Clostridiaceae bacterium]|nr:type II toxin-antitoxin system HicA family toxin [Clostridiaceae bacterium]
MSKKDNIIEKLLQRSANFTYDEAKSLLGKFGYKEDSRGKTSGSRVAFIHEKGHIIRLHKPHPQNTLKLYQIDELIQVLKSQGLIEL